MSLLEDYGHLWMPEPNTGCYLWHGSTSRGMGYVKINKKMKVISRLVCEEAYGEPETPKHEAAHATPNGCVGGVCINPGHLRWATRSENQLDTPVKVRVARSRKAGTAATASFTPEGLKERSRKGVEARPKP